MLTMWKLAIFLRKYGSYSIVWCWWPSSNCSNGCKTTVFKKISGAHNLEGESDYKKGYVQKSCQYCDAKNVVSTTEFECRCTSTIKSWTRNVGNRKWRADWGTKNREKASRLTFLIAIELFMNLCQRAKQWMGAFIM